MNKQSDLDTLFELTTKVFNESLSNDLNTETTYKLELSFNKNGTIVAYKYSLKGSTITI